MGKAIGEITIVENRRWGKSKKNGMANTRKDMINK